jgi:hypothetical protein
MIKYEFLPVSKAMYSNEINKPEIGLCDVTRFCQIDLFLEE